MWYDAYLKISVGIIKSLEISNLNGRTKRGKMRKVVLSENRILGNNFLTVMKDYFLPGRDQSRVLSVTSPKQYNSLRIFQTMVSS